MFQRAEASFSTLTSFFRGDQGDHEAALQANWMPDHVAASCYSCSIKFTAFRRRHHCRVCGQIFCHACCSVFVDGASLGKERGTRLRICSYCHDFHQKNRSEQGSSGRGAVGASVSAGRSSSAAELREQQRRESSRPSSVSPVDPYLGDVGVAAAPVDPYLSPGGGGNASSGNEDDDDDCGITTPGAARRPRRRVSEFALPSLSMSSIGPALTTSASTTMINPQQHHSQNRGLVHHLHHLHMHFNKQDPAVREELVREMTAILGTVFSGSYLLRWLTSRNNSSDARPICQNLLEKGYIVETTNVEPDVGKALFDESETYRTATTGEMADIRTAEDYREDDTVGPDWLKKIRQSSSAIGVHNDENSEAATATADLSDNVSDCVSEIAEEAVEGNGSLASLVSDDRPRFVVMPAISKRKNSSEEIFYTSDIEQIAKMEKLQNEYLDKLVTELLRREGLSTHTWREIVLALSLEAVNEVRPRPGLDPIDIRSLIKIKKLPGGDPTDSCIIPGEVFTLRVHQRDLVTSLENPKILLLAGALSCHRDNTHGHVDLQSLAAMEDDYIRSICGKIKSFKPDLVLVETTITQKAQEVLTELGIAFVFNVRASIMARLERIFETDVVSSVLSLVQPPTLGSAESFEIREHWLPPHSVHKAVVLLRREDGSNGCTVVLRGGGCGGGRGSGCDEGELSRLKRVIRRVALVAANCVYEKAFLVKEYAAPEIRDGGAMNLDDVSLSPFIALEKDDNLQPPKDPKKPRKQVPFDCVKADSGSEHAMQTSSMHANADSASTRNMLSAFKASASERPTTVTKLQHDLIQNTKRSENATPSVDSAYDADQRDFPVLFSSFSTVAGPVWPYYCVVPWIVHMRFYATNDISVGAFLANYCFNENYMCPNRHCDVPMWKHVRRFCHGRSCVAVTCKVTSFDPDQIPSADTDPPDAIYMWKSCDVCSESSRVATPLVAMSRMAKSYSLAMLLLMLFTENKLKRRKAEEQNCLHSIHQEHTLCFYMRNRDNYIVSFRYHPIDPYDVSFPGKTVKVGCRVADDKARIAEREAILEECKQLNVQGPIIFSDILEHIHTLKPEFFMQTVEEAIAATNREYSSDFELYRELQRSLNDDVEGDSAGVEDAIFKIKKFMARSNTRWRRKLSQLSDLKRREEKAFKQSGNRSRTDSGNVASGGAENGGVSVSTNPDALSPPPAASPADVTDAPSIRIRERRSNKSTNYDAALKTPFPPCEHLTLSPEQTVIVDEKQPSSLIAHALTSSEYDSYINGIDPCDVSDAKSSAASDAAAGSAATSSSSISSASSPNFEFQFNDETCKFYVCVYHAREFHAFRQEVVRREDAEGDANGGRRLNAFAKSLARCEMWHPSGGKSGTTFYKTKDDRFVIKRINKPEHKCVTGPFGPKYCDYIRSTPNSSLCKIVGVYTIGFQNWATTKESLHIDVVVMENLMYGRDIRESFDLKGCLRNRYTSPLGQADRTLVLLDVNLLNSSCEKPLYISPSSKQKLLGTITMDTDLLCSHNLMDYSLLLGIDRQKNELVLGIIDYIREFTWDKRMENVVKESILYSAAGGGGGDKEYKAAHASIIGTGSIGGKKANNKPTIVNPESYRDRFLQSMYKYFILVPDFRYRPEKQGKKL